VPRWARAVGVLLVLFPGFLLTVLLARSSAAWGLAMIVPSAAGIWLGSWGLLAYRQVFVSPLLPVVTLTAVFTVLTSIRFLRADRQVRERTRKLALTQDAIIQSLAALTETRHHETGGHIQRTRHYIRVLAGHLQARPEFRTQLDDATVDLLFRLAPLHDIGKVGVRDRILLKPARLTPEEYEEMKRHTLYGSETIRLAKRMMGEDAFFQIADDLVLNHHERWDGTGYPNGLREEAIPLPGRLMAVADAYDAIISPASTSRRSPTKRRFAPWAKNGGPTSIPPYWTPSWKSTRSSARSPPASPAPASSQNCPPKRDLVPGGGTPAAGRTGGTAVQVHRTASHERSPRPPRRRS